MTSFDINLFDDCQKAIYRLIETDSWPRFIKTPLYSRLVKKLTKREFVVEKQSKKKASIGKSTKVKRYSNEEIKAKSQHEVKPFIVGV